MSPQESRQDRGDQRGAQLPARELFASAAAISTALNSAFLQGPRARSARPPLLGLINTISLLLLILALSLPPAFFGLQALLPVGTRNALYRELLRHPSLSEVDGIAGVVVLNLGKPICGAAFVANLIFLFLRGVPTSLKVATTLLVLTAIFGAIQVASSVVVFR